jgi:hypothetical protein
MPITASNRPRAAEFIRVEDVAKAPPLRNDGPFSRAASLVHFIEETWLKAINNTDSDAYLALLDPRFSAFVQQKDAQPSVITREQWPAERKPPLGTGTALGPVDVVFLPDPEHKADVTLWERTTANAACQINQRTLTLAQQLNAEGEPDGPWTIRRESISASRSCEKSDLGGVLKTHRRLVAAWKMSDSSTLSELASGEFLHRDAGVEVERYDLDALTQGEGRWVMEVLAESAATEDDIEQYGDRAVLRLGSTHRVVYGRRGETWRLMGLYRHPAAQPK